MQLHKPIGTCEKTLPNSEVELPVVAQHVDNDVPLKMKSASGEFQYNPKVKTDDSEEEDTTCNDATNTGLSSMSSVSENSKEGSDNREALEDS